MRGISGFSFRPKSFFTLVLIGFCLVVLPLAVALVSGVFYVDRLFVQSEYAVYRASQASQVSRGLVGLITEMERHVRQYQVLGDAALWEGYIERREEFAATANNLTSLSESDFFKALIDTLRQKEEVLYLNLSGKDDSLRAGLDVIAEFDGLDLLSQTIVQESQNWINSQVSTLADMANETEHLLMWQAIALVPGTVLFSVFLSAMIARPIRQIDHVIRALGDGQFDEEVRVKGPRDMQYLGEQLNWLRLRLVELDERKGHFLRHVSHELKTPLTAIREGSALLSEGLLGDLTRKQREVIDLLQRNAVTLQHMIENLLNFNMLQEKRAALHLRDVNFDEMVEDVAGDHKIALLAKKLKLYLNCDPANLEGDEQKLRTVVDNLLSNAIKFSPVRGTVRVTLRASPTTVVLSVCDEGPGVVADEAEKVFEAFYRGSNPGRPSARGSGIGLAIAKEFVIVHNGTIELIQDDTPGAHFRVTLPLSQSKAVA